ncbi:MAG: MOSC domain-containing protein [Acidobacteria bacterium]|nr:MOSC domain-containing protein [Acidobacteriota bacterium]
MQGKVERIYVAPQGGVEMQKVSQVEALDGCGLEGDRYCSRTGYWTDVDECQVTLIAAEDLEDIQRITGVRVDNGEHRRNLITRGIELESLSGKRFQVGQAILEFDRPRPPCSYIQSITQPGMTRALAGHSGICARVVQSGLIQEEDSIEVL